MTQGSTPESPLSRFQIQQYELHVATYEIDASSSAEAIKRLFEGDGDMLDGSEFVGTCRDTGMSLDEHPQLAVDLRRLGVEIRGSILPSIRRICRIEDGHEQNAKE